MRLIRVAFIWILLDMQIEKRSLTTDLLTLNLIYIDVKIVLL